ncbi:MAG: pheST operon leader peptide PheM [Escherichia coli]
MNADIFSFFFYFST